MMRGSFVRDRRYQSALSGVARPLVLSVLLTIALCIVLVIPTTALALSVDKTTARPNDPNGSAVLAGIPTRVTWEGTVGAGEDVAALALQAPDGVDISGSSITVTVLDGLDRIPVEPETSIEDQSVNVRFVSPIKTGMLIRIELPGTRLPISDGDIVFTGSYETGSGENIALADSPGLSTTETSLTTKAVSWLDEQGWVEAWNSNKFLSMFFKPQLIVTSIPSLFFGWLRALALVALGFPLAIPLGLAFAFMKMSALRPLRWLSSLYINVVRGTPLFLQVYIAFFGLPLLGINIDSYVLGVGVLAMNSSAYLAEIFRAGIESIPKGQFEAAASLGMNKIQTMTSVILPQTARRVIPTMTSEFILLYKDTSLLSSVGVLELMMFSKNLTATTGNITPYIVAAGYYLIVTLPLIKVVGLLEKRLALQETGRDRPSGDDEEIQHEVVYATTAHESR